MRRRIVRNKKSKKRWSEQSQRNHHHHLESTAITVKCLAMTRLPVIRTTRRRKRITLFDFFLLIFRIRFRFLYVDFERFYGHQLLTRLAINIGTESGVCCVLN
ncbi:hypothetical protein OSTOST_22680 [Ostertagia ostertagi]